MTLSCAALRREPSAAPGASGPGKPVLTLAASGFAAEVFDFQPEPLVLCLFAGQEALGGFGLGGEAFGGQFVQVPLFALASGEVPGLDVALVQQCLKAAVNLTQADAEFFPPGPRDGSSSSRHRRR